VRRVLTLFAFMTAAILSTVPASAQTSGVLDAAASRLKSDPVYVDDRAERKVDAAAADRLRRQIRSSESPIFIAILPASATEEAGGKPTQVPRDLGEKVNLAGTYAAVAGNSFRAASSVLPTGRADALATTSFQAKSGEGTEAVLADFITRVSTAGRSQPGATSANGNGSEGGQTGDLAGESSESGGPNLWPVVLLAGGVGGGLYLWQRSKRRREQEAQFREQAADAKDRELLQAELAVVAEDVIALEPQLALHPDARADYDAAVARYRVAQVALDRADDRIDLVRVERVLEEARYAMDRARATIDGRPPPPPPPDLSRPGRRGEPALEMDDRGEPAYAGFGSPFYGGGWFGGGGGLLTGLFLGQMLGGWGGGWGGGHHETNVYADDGGDSGGGDGGDSGGGDWSGGDWGGGDFGGGDFGGGGDW
jgi:hypothetical protein